MRCFEASGWAALRPEGGAGGEIRLGEDGRGRTLARIAVARGLGASFLAAPSSCGMA